MVAGVAMGIGAMSAVMLTLPLTSVLLATIMLGSGPGSWGSWEGETRQHGRAGDVAENILP
jgi:hypothetical protein